MKAQKKSIKGFQTMGEGLGADKMGVGWLS